MNKGGVICISAISIIILVSIFLILFSNNIPFISSQIGDNTTFDLRPIDWIGTKSIYAVTYDMNNSLIYLGGNGVIFGSYNRTSRVLENLSATDPGDWLGTNNVSKSINSLVYDFKNQLVYLGGWDGVFGVYNRTSNVTIDLRETDTGNWWGTSSPVRALAFDSNNSLIYLGGDSGKFGVYNRTSNIMSDLNATNYSSVLSLAYDFNKSLVYFAGTKFAVYNKTNGIIENLTTKIPAGWTGIQRLTYNSKNGLVYLAGNNGKFGAYNRTSNTTQDLSDRDTGDWIGSSTIYGMTYDSDNDSVYLLVLSTGHEFGVYNPTTNITSELSETDPSDWMATDGQDMVYDFNNKLTYLVGYLGVFAAYNRTSNITENLRNRSADDWIGVSRNIDKMTYDTNNNLIYLVGTHAVFGSYNRTSDLLVDLTGTDALDWIDSHNIFTVLYEPDNDLVYLGVDSEKIGIYNQTANTTENISSGFGVVSISEIHGLAYDSNSKLIYFAGYNSDTFAGFGVYNRTNGTAENLEGTVISNNVFKYLDLAYDSNNNLIYLCGEPLTSETAFQVYNRATNTTTDLNYTDTGDWWSNSRMGAMAYDFNNSLLYLVGDIGKFGVYNKATNVMSDLRSADTGDWIGTNSIYGVTYDSHDKLVYLVGYNGVFGVYDPDLNVVEDLRATDTGDWIGTTPLNSVTYDSNNGLIYLAGDSGKIGIYNRTANATIQAETGEEFPEGDTGGGVVTTPGTTTPIEVEAGEPVTVDIEGSTSLNQIIITSNATVNGTIAITPTTRPRNTDLRIAGEGQVYEAFRITTTGINNSNIENVTIRFKVNISWTIAERVDPANVFLYRNTALPNRRPRWEELPTTFLSSDSQYYYYEAISPGFSDFAVYISLTSCEIGSVRCFNNEIQLCTGNSTWVVTESCGDGQCVDNQCIGKEVQIVKGFLSSISTIFSGSAIFYIAVVLVSSGLIVVAYYMLRKKGKKR